MSTQQIALARRLRPRTFQEVVGQEVTLQALSNALKTGRLHHAYLFTGTQGVGKTTLARIFAKCLNCEQGISASPCGECESCRAIDAACSVDVLEIDAASRTKVEDTRELLENVQYLPTRARYKIYLIDEVHMLSTHSFNALLKTLEEPPPHVKFLFATTDPQKLPVTVLSRCLQFHLHRLPFGQIVSHLQNTLTKEAIEFDVTAIEVIARSAEGSLRDALSLLEQGIAYCGERLTEERVRKMLQCTETSSLLHLSQYLLEGQGKKALQEIENLANKTTDFSNVLSELLMLFRHIAILQTYPDALEESVSYREKLLQWAKQISAEEIQLYYQIGVLGQKELPYAPNARIGFEMVILRMLTFQPCAGALSSSLLPKVQVREEKKENIQAVEQEEEKKPKQKAEQEAEQREEKEEEQKETLFLKKEKEKEKKDEEEEAGRQPQKLNWTELVLKLNLSGITKQLAEHCTLVDSKEDAIHLLLEENQKPLLQQRHEEKLKNALSEHFGKPCRLKITVGKIRQGTPTPAVHLHQQQQIAHEEAYHAMETDPKLNQLIKAFDAKINEIEILK